MISSMGPVMVSLKKALTIFGNTSGSGDASGGLYGAGKFGYSAASSSQELLASADGNIAENVFISSSVSHADVDFEPDLIATASLVKLKVRSQDLSSADLKAVRSFQISGAGITTHYPAYTKVNGDNIEFVVAPASAGTLGANGTASIEFSKETSATSGDFEADAGSGPPETDVNIPEIDISMRSIAIVAKTRKLKAVWTPELAQDLNAYHSVDAEAELTSMLSEYVSMEIDLEILDMLLADAAAKKEYWSAKVGYEYSSDSFSEVSGNSNAYTKGEWFQTLGNKIQAVSNAIHQKTLRGGANFIVVSPETATIIESIPGYASAADGDAMSNKYAMGVQKVGALNNRYTVYKNPYMLENQILVGFRGSNFLETGAVYAPYIPLIMTPLVYDPVNFTPRKGVMTRYAKKMVRPEFYGKVIVADVDMV